MVLYLDIVFLFNVFTNFVFLYFMEKMFKDDYSVGRILIASAIGGIIVVASIFSYVLVIIFKIFSGLIIVLIGLKKVTISKTIIKISTFYLENFSLVGFLKGFEINTLLFFLFAVAAILTTFFLENFKKYYIFIASQKYNIIIKVNNKYYKMNGFLDTGNSATTSIGIPIVIVSNEFETVKNINDEIVFIDTISGSKAFNAHFIEEFYIKINKKWIKKKVYIVFNKTNHDCLLNNLLFI